MTLRNRRILLAKRPVGVPVDTDYAFDEVPVPDASQLVDGQVLVRNLYLALDPAIRGWMNESKGSYMPPIALGEPVRSGNVCEIVASTVAGIDPGQIHQCLGGWEEYSVLDKRALHGRIESQPGIPVHSAIHLLGGSGLTAYFGLLDVGQPKPGEVVVVSAASGSVGSLVGQMARIAGCRTVGITSDPEKAKWLVESLGYDVAIDRVHHVTYGPGGASAKHTDFRTALKETCPKGVDVFFDSVGGEILDTVLARLQVGARIALCGAIANINATEPAPGPRNYVHLLAKRARMQGFVTIDYAKRYPEARAQIADWVSEGNLRFHEELVIGLENTPGHFLRLFDGTHRGKLMVKLSDPKGS
jgi:NADPH-dependent curcumin reductase CurA